jgi:hypothetical protein
METWALEYYPTQAWQLDTESMTDVELIEHSLTKWIGLNPENLEEHGVNRLDALMLGLIGGYSCALCRKYATSCTLCPLDKMGENCFNEDSAYQAVDDNGFKDPFLMIEALAECLDIAIKQEDSDNG